MPYFWAEGWAIVVIHYPTTDHKIMQRRSVLAGKTGLMLSYIPNETNDKGREILQPFEATIVCEHLQTINTLKLFLPRGTTS